MTADFAALEQRIFERVQEEMRENHDHGDEQPLTFNEVVDAWATRRIHEVEAAHNRIESLNKYLKHSR